MVSKRSDSLDRWEKAKSRTAHTHAVRDSYNSIVPPKQANEGPQSRISRDHRPEESDQGRGLAQGKAARSPTTGTQSPGEKVSRGLDGIREAAERNIPGIRELFCSAGQYPHAEKLPSSFGPNMA